MAKGYPGVPLLMSQPGVGAVTALAFVLTLGDVHRFPRGKQVASYLGLAPREHSSRAKQRMGGISKQGNRLLRFLLVEAANIAVRFDPELRKEYLHRCHQKHFTVAKVATARKLAIIVKEAIIEEVSRSVRRTKLLCRGSDSRLLCWGHIFHKEV
ncbi:transposase [Tunturiibacter gelidiferens]|uniref:transposase n=1 Tax=Tunturiibacter gelidiferens TaxID=3069689 RepID=UPI003D9BA377